MCTTCRRIPATSRTNKGSNEAMCAFTAGISGLSQSVWALFRSKEAHRKVPSQRANPAPAWRATALDKSQSPSPSHDPLMNGLSSLPSPSAVAKCTTVVNSVVSTTGGGGSGALRPKQEKKADKQPTCTSVLSCPPRSARFAATGRQLAPHLWASARGSEMRASDTDGDTWRPADPAARHNTASPRRSTLPCCDNMATMAALHGPANLPHNQSDPEGPTLWEMEDPLVVEKTSDSCRGVFKSQFFQVGLKSPWPSRPKVDT